jgi:ABC-type nitrate/sulfonate/bicarbonate transport system permease component
VRERAIASIGAILFFGAWEGASRISPATRLFFPGPLTVLETAKDLVSESSWWLLVLKSLLHYLSGTLLGISLGFSIGMLEYASKDVRSLCSVPLKILRPIPPLAWVPLTIVWFGITDFAATFIITVGVFWPAYDGASVGLAGVDRKYIELARAFRRDTFWDRLLNVMLPAALPAIVAGARSALGLGWMLVIAAELTGVTGIGQYMWEAGGLMATDRVLICMGTIACSYMIVESLMRTLERRIGWGSI